MNQIAIDGQGGTRTGGRLDLLASNVTGTRNLPFQFDPGLPVRAVTDAIAADMSLPADVPWALRSDDSSAYLDDGRPIGDQLEPGSRVTLTPRSHLGGAGGAGTVRPGGHLG